MYGLSKFTLKGNELTFKATDFEARNNANYRVNIKATLSARSSFYSMFFPPIKGSISLLLLVASVIALSVFSGVETSAVVIRSATSSSTLLTSTDGVDVDSPLVYEWIVPTGITDVTNRDTKRISFTTTEAMEGRTNTCRRFIYIGYGYSKDFFSRLIALGGFDINTISGITSGFKICGFES
jgi:hypothetical protein